MPTPVSPVTSVLSQSFDYIVCGGGTAGCVIATRLAENPNTTVLLIEAGQHNDLIENTKIPGRWTELMDTTDDWNIITLPQKSVSNRLFKLTRGRFLGGSSGINGTLAIRGVLQDFDDWEVKGWSGAEFWPYMIKAEAFHPKDWFRHDPESHGTSGYLHTAPQDPAPITDLAFRSMQSQGFPYDPDMFSSGKNAHGCGHAVRTVHGGIRSTAADFIEKSGENLWILTEAIVDKVNITSGEHDDELKATGVEIFYKETLTTIKAKREILICGGAYCSPGILLRSGIGPKAEVESFGIDCKLDLPGVGKNLMDHLLTFIFYEVDKPGLTTDHLIYCADGDQKSYLQWKEKKSSFLSGIPFGAICYARLDERLKDSKLWQESERKEGRDPMGLTPSQPNIELLSTECYGGPSREYTDFPPEGKSVFAMALILFGQQSRGTVTLKTKDPLSNPVVDHNYLSDPLDLLIMSEACKLANEIVTRGEGTKDIVKGAWPPGSNHHLFKTREEWESFVKQSGLTSFHASGSCKMGPDSDPMAVVDERLRVRGIKGIRVADASIIPILHSGHPQLPVYGIAEKCADMIKEDNEF
ncbi:hypothetical protein Clacol_004269 [Clathrus columnatus]|uniref:Glucose-methanol-choline oxidoreductase N-terminal domain-containing protein n=1 Tax=Clathrus columnatus TaxID=1419009 RepID=A0AAV5AA44_9AGAM|nr:hypothetical protein Clacol_004269 [Clathrus columnatus]